MKYSVRVLFAYVVVILDQRTTSNIPCSSGQATGTSIARAELRYGECEIGTIVKLKGGWDSDLDIWHVIWYITSE
jgi:hypothetical protein